MSTPIATPAETNTVYVTNLNEEHDFTAAERWGELVFVTKGYTILSDLDKLEKKLQTHVDKSQPTDFIVLSGANILCSMFVLLWQKKHGYVNILHFSKKSKQYEHYVIR